MNIEDKPNVFPWCFFHAIGKLDATPKMKGFLYALATHSDRHGYCYPSRDKIAKYSGISLRSVYNYANEASAKGWIDKECNAVKVYVHGQKRHLNKYRLLLSTNVDDGDPF